jgi:uncharacterized protein YdeI (YjbR/CyaY-like superfamily)
VKAANDVGKMAFESRKTFETWLEQNHDKSKGVWVMMAKKGAGIVSVTYDEAVETALAYGWIDSQVSAFDYRYYLQKFTPRGSKSAWSRTNRDKATELIGSGKMKPSGMRQVELAKANGEWDKAGLR